MADYFENMCVGIPLEGTVDTVQAKIVWWKAVKEILCSEFNPEDDFTASLNLPEEAQDCTICDINIEGDAVYLMDDGGVLQTDGLVAILQAYLEKFDPDGAICVEVAFTCSKHQPDGFGGCAIVVTKDDAKYKTLGKACDEMLKEMGVAGERVRTVKYT